MAFYSKYHRISHKTPKGFRMFNIYKNLLARYLLYIYGHLRTFKDIGGHLRTLKDIEPKLFRIFAPSKTKKLKI